MPTTTRTPPDRPRLARGRWSVDAEHSHARFTARTLAGLVPVPGRFRTLAGSLSVAARDTIGALVIDAASIHTGNRLRDRHLRSRAFFATARHPELRYEVDSLVVGDRDASIDGELVVRDTRTRLPLAAELRHHGDDVIEIACRTQLDRLALGIRGARGMVPSTVDLDVVVRLRRDS